MQVADLEQERGVGADHGAGGRGKVRKLGKVNEPRAGSEAEAAR
jgi:hypothetical protein